VLKRPADDRSDGPEVADVEYADAVSARLDEGWEER